MLTVLAPYYLISFIRTSKSNTLQKAKYIAFFTENCIFLKKCNKCLRNSVLLHNLTLFDITTPSITFFLAAFCIKCFIIFLWYQVGLRSLQLSRLSNLALSSIDTKYLLLSIKQTKMGKMWNWWLYQIPGLNAGQAGSQPSLWCPGKELRAPGGGTGSNT